MEKRHIRVEDWAGNVYVYNNDSSSSTAGSIIDSSSASNDPSSNTYTDGTHTSDPSANGGTATILTSGSSRKTLYTTEISNLSFGRISVGMRIKSSVGTGIVNLLEVNAYFVDASGEEPSYNLINSTTFKGSDFGVANEYVTLGTVFDYKGVATGDTRLKIELIVLPDTGVTFYFDTLAVAMEMPSASGESAYVDGSIVVLP